jgi:hypothetical protein
MQQQPRTRILLDGAHELGDWTVGRIHDLID